MEMIKLKCPYCDADLISENDLDVFYCKYCGGKIILEGLSDEIVKARSRANELEFEKEKLKYEAEEKEKDFQRHMISKKADQEHEVKKAKARGSWVGSLFKGFAIFLAVDLAFLFLLDGIDAIEDKRNESLQSEIIEMIEEGEYEKAEKKLDSFKDGSSYSKWREVKEDLFKDIRRAEFNESDIKEKKIGISSADARKMMCDDAVKYFQDAGFFNIDRIESSKRRGIHKYDSIDKITVNGSEFFEAEDVFSKDVKIIITYYD